MEIITKQVFIDSNIGEHLNNSSGHKQSARLGNLSRYVQQSSPRRQQLAATVARGGLLHDDKFETEEVSERSNRQQLTQQNALKTKQVLSNIIQDTKQRSSGFIRKITYSEEEEEKAGLTPEAEEFAIIPEHSMEVSNSNKNSNALEESGNQKKTEEATHDSRGARGGPVYDLYGSKERDNQPLIKSIDLGEIRQMFRSGQETQTRRN